MFYTIYKITNKINGKFYIGMHKTRNLDDGYMGSGKLIKAAIKKYGLDSFTKEILFIFDNEEDMRAKEKELVVLSEQSYNLCDGGKGGFGYINRSPKSKEWKSLANKKWREIHPDASKRNAYITNKIKKENPSIEVKRKETLLKRYGSAGVKSFLGKKHVEETKQRISLKAKVNSTGIKNSQYGTCWITNGQENKKIKKDDIDIWLEKGYNKGRSAPVTAMQTDA